MNNEKKSDSEKQPECCKNEAECKSCKTGVCSPCLIIWGLVVIALVLNYLLAR